MWNEYFCLLDLSHFVFFYLVTFFKQKQTVQPAYHNLTTTFFYLPLLQKIKNKFEYALYICSIISLPTELSNKKKIKKKLGNELR